MSIISSLVIVISILCYLCLSTSTIASRRLIGDLVNQEVVQYTKFQDPLKDDDEKKLKFERAFNIDSSSHVVNTFELIAKQEMKSTKKLKSESESKSGSGSDLKSKKGEHQYHKLRHGKQGHKASNPLHWKKKNSEKLANKRSKFPKVVSWRVPRTKIEVTQTGFNLDYAPPKVHPPTHN